MDQFTKLVSSRLKAQAAPGPHPAPELLSAFAENALPEADRGHVLQHVGACSDCREILYLALPEAPELQKVLVPQPRPFRRWGLGWGALVASVAVVAIFFTTNRLVLKDQRVSTVAIAPAAPPETETKIAADKTPAELDQIQSARDADRARISSNLTTEPKPQPEAKHMTAKLQAPMVFDQSGEVHVQSPAPPASGVASGIKGDRGDDTEEKLKLKEGPGIEFSRAAVQPASAEPAAGQQTADQVFAIGQSKSSVLQAEARNAPSPTAPARETSAGSNLGGIVLDPSGAVVSNAKVTTVGPAGAKTVTTDSAGKFSFDKLSPGLYSIKAEANGFKSTEIKEVAVLDNKTSSLPVTLEVGVTSDVVEVTGAADTIESSTALVAETQPTAQLSMQKAASAHAKRQAVGGAIGSGAGAATLSWTLSPEGTVRRSGDGGKTWEPVSVAFGAAPFRALSAVGANIWVGGKAGSLYHSADFGQTWAKFEPVAGGKKLDQDIMHVDFSDALTGTVNTANGEVWTTSDGGQTWQRK